VEEVFPYEHNVILWILSTCCFQFNWWLLCVNNFVYSLQFKFLFLNIVIYHLKLLMWTFSLFSHFVILSQNPSFTSKTWTQFNTILCRLSMSKVSLLILVLKYVCILWKSHIDDDNNSYNFFNLDSFNFACAKMFLCVLEDGKRDCWKLWK
jgi:hypothetical protein